MIIVYYTDASGKITHHHKAPENKTEQELIEMAKDFNGDPKGGGRTAHIEEVKDGTITSYFYELAEKKYELAKGTLRSAIDSLEEAKDFLQSLSI